MEREEEKERKESRCLSQGLQQKKNDILSSSTLCYAGVRTFRFKAQTGTVLVRSLIESPQGLDLALRGKGHSGEILWTLVPETMPRGSGADSFHDSASQDFMCRALLPGVALPHSLLTIWLGCRYSRTASPPAIVSAWLS